MSIWYAMQQSGPGAAAPDHGASPDGDLRDFARERGRRTSGSARLGEILVAQGLVTQAELETALHEQQSGAEWRVGRLLVQSGAIDEAELIRAVAEQFDATIWNLRANPPRVSALRSLAAGAARQLRALPIAFADGALLVAVSDPPTRSMRTMVERSTGTQVRLVLCQADELDAALEYWYCDDEAPSDAASAPAITAASTRRASIGSETPKVFESVRLTPDELALLRDLLSQLGGLVVVAAESAELARSMASMILREAQESERIVVYIGPPNDDPATGVIRLVAGDAASTAIAVDAAAWLDAEVLVFRTSVDPAPLATVVGAVAPERTTIVVCEDTNIADAVIALYGAVGGSALAQAMRAVITVTGRPTAPHGRIRELTDEMREALLDPNGAPHREA